MDITENTILNGVEEVHSNISNTSNEVPMDTGTSTIDSSFNHEDIINTDISKSINDESKTSDIDTKNNTTEDIIQENIEFDYCFSDEDVVSLKYKNREKRHTVPLENHSKQNPPEFKQRKSKFKCVMCSNKFSTKAHLIRHMKIHDKKVTFTCALCLATFDTNHDLLTHKVIHQNEDRDYSCSKCDKEFEDDLQYLLHQYEHSKTKTLVCKECGRRDTIKNKTAFEAHVKTHFDTTTVKCDICRRLVKAYSLDNHMETRHRKTCVECEKVIKKPGELEIHMQIHTGVRLFQCLNCGKGFSQAQARNKHFETHTGKTYNCKICLKAFSREDYAISHEKRHHSDIRYECPVCKKKFKGKYSRDDHLTTHSNMEKYECKLCGKKIHTRTGMKDHMVRFHFEGRSYGCEVCKTSFKSARELKQHKGKKVHINNAYGLKMAMQNS